MKRRNTTLALGVMALALSVVATPAIGQEPHPDGPGHLPASAENVKVVSKLQLTNVDGGIADVGYFKGFAYLNAFSPECAGRPGAEGTGVHVVDIRKPRFPQKVGFLPAEENSYVGEGIHIMEVDTPHFTGDLLVHNNETCDSNLPVTSGVSIWDVTDPKRPSKIGQFGDTTPPVANQTYHTTHSVQGFTQPGKAFVVLQDNQDVQDVDIVDVTDPSNPVMASESGILDWPETHAPLANGDTVFNHDMQFKRIDGTDYLLVSYWDAGQVLLNVNDPYNPEFVANSDYRTPDPLMPEFDIPEGNSHQSYWSSNNRWILSTDEDFSPYRTNCEIETGPNAGATPCGEFGFTPAISSIFPDGFSGTTVWGGSGCIEDADGNGTGDRDEVLANHTRAQTGADAIVFSRGVCFFSDKIHTGELAGYDMVFVGQSHVGTRNGLLPDAFLCGGQGSPIDETAAAGCIGHRAMHQLFGDEPTYTGADFADMPAKGTLGERISAVGGVFDGWGYVQLHDATSPTLEITDSYAVPEALDPDFAEGFGILSVHEVKTDPRPGVNLAYFSYYNAGFRVTEFGSDGITEVGHLIDEGGNHFWGVFPIGNETAGHGFESDKPVQRYPGPAPKILLSDRDFGLYIVEYTGRPPKRDG